MYVACRPPTLIPLIEEGLSNMLSKQKINKYIIVASAIDRRHCTLMYCNMFRLKIISCNTTTEFFALTTSSGFSIKMPRQTKRKPNIKSKETQIKKTPRPKRGVKLPAKLKESLINSSIDFIESPPKSRTNHSNQNRENSLLPIGSVKKISNITNIKKGDNFVALVFP